MAASGYQSGPDPGRVFHPFPLPWHMLPLPVCLRRPVRIVTGGLAYAAFGTSRQVAIGTAPWLWTDSFASVHAFSRRLF